MRKKLIKILSSNYFASTISNTSLNPSTNSGQAQHKPCPELREGSVRDLVVNTETTERFLSEPALS